MMAEDGAELLPGAAPFLPTLLGMTPGTMASSPHLRAGGHFVAELWSPFPSPIFWAPAELLQSKENVSVSLSPWRSLVSLFPGNEGAALALRTRPCGLCIRDARVRSNQLELSGVHLMPGILLQQSERPE